MSKFNTSFDCYKIEARVASDIKIGNLILTKEWKQVPMELSDKPIGVASDLRDINAARSGYLGYNQAKALEYQMHSELYLTAIGLETRLVQYRGSVSITFEETNKVSLPLKTLFPHGTPDLLVEKDK